MAYVSITIEGGLFPADLLDDIATGEAEGQRASDFRLEGNRRLADEIQSAFSDARIYWEAFQHRLGRSTQSRTTLTREDWMLKFLETIGFNQLQVQRSSAEVGGETYFISHRAGGDPDAPPVHIVSIDQDLDRRDGQARRSAHALVQEYLNRSDALWGLVSNGGQLRLLRNTARLSKPTYLEFDLQGMMEGNHYSEFALLYRLIHSSHFPQPGANAHECLLEKYYQQGIDQGSRVRDKLRDGVKDALEVLGTAFLIHRDSEALRRKISSGQVDANGYYRQLLRLVYRFLFLMVAEERRLIFPPEMAATEKQSIYHNYYSIARLRERAERYFVGDREGDLWIGLNQTFRLFRDNTAAGQLGLSALNGELFGAAACSDIEGAGCSNEELLRSIRYLSTFMDDDQGRRGRRTSGQRRRVNYAALDVEEFGSVYESLLDFHPQVTLNPLSFDLIAGSERKQTGSYYTPPDLVRELIESALIPVIEDRLKSAKTTDEKQQALLDLRVCDPASGSGHFLLAAARRIARELAHLRSTEGEPPPEQYREALRGVIRNCIYAVDKNPLAVDLCKVALWIEGHNAGLPLSFLDHHIKCGDSLVGVFDLEVLAQGIPDDAYKPVTGDNKTAARSYQKRNHQEKLGQTRMDFATGATLPEVIAEEFQALAELEERTPDDVRSKEELYASLREQGSEWFDLKVACDLWTAAFFLPLAPEDGFHRETVPTTGTVRRYLAQPEAGYGPLVGQVVELSLEHPFFHWPLEFPEVFEKDGFDVVLGNPPWERIKLQEQEFFSSRDYQIAKAPNKAARERLIKELPKRNRALAQEFEEAKHTAEAASKFVRSSDRFPLAGRGDINTYTVFAEAARQLLNAKGRTGIIVPSGIATDDTTKYLFADLVEKKSLASLFDFENREGIFPGVHRSYKFCLLTLSGTEWPVQHANFAFFLHRADQLRDEEQRFSLTAADFQLLNPNTRTCPIFRTRHDAEITRAIYQRVPVLIDEDKGVEGNPWGIRFSTMFHMSNDSSLFRSRQQLEVEGWRLEGNVFTRLDKKYLPLYEAKLIHQFDHRWATYEGEETRDLTLLEKGSPECLVMPRYWVLDAEVAHQLEGKWSNQWLVTSRMMARSTDERTIISSFIPQSGVGNSAAVWLVSEDHTYSAIASLVANLNSYVLDFVAQQKVGGANLNFFILRQFAVLTPAGYAVECPWSNREILAEWIAVRVVELIYTASDLRALGQRLGHEGPPFRWDEQRRFTLRCELDAAFFHLYGINREDVDYIMDTFPIVKRRDEQLYREYRTKRVILEIYDEMVRAMQTGQSYQTRRNPPPGGLP